jgi:hypothetical protein
LGTLPFGDGRQENPGKAYVTAIVIEGNVHRFKTAPPLRWKRYLTRRDRGIGESDGSWFVLENQDNKKDNADDTSDGGNDGTPSATGKIYSYDNSGMDFGNLSGHNGDYRQVKKQFVYEVDAQVSGVWIKCASIKVAQVIVIKMVNGQWQAVSSTVTEGDVDCNITQQEVRDLVGGTEPIIIP